MGIFRFFEKRFREFTIWDVKLLQFSAIFLILAVAKLFPSILNINILWFVILWVLFTLRPGYLIFVKK